MNPREIFNEVDRLGATLYWDSNERKIGCSSYLPEELQDAIVANEEELLKLMGVDWQGHGTYARFPKDDEA